MKDRDRRKLHAVLILLAAISVAVGTGLIITFIALGILLVYVKNHFGEWNEKRKEKIKAKKIEEEENKPSLLTKLKNKFKKSEEKDEEDCCDDEEKCPQNYMKYDSSDFQVTPPQFNSNENTSGELRIQEYPSATPKGRTYDDDLNTIAIIDNKNKRKNKRKKKIRI